jgi:hypothetical protein
VAVGAAQHQSLRMFFALADENAVSHAPATLCHYRAAGVAALPQPFKRLAQLSLFGT